MLALSPIEAKHEVACDLVVGQRVDCGADRSGIAAEALNGRFDPIECRKAGLTMMSIIP